MSLLNDFFEEYNVIDRTREPDGEGGQETTYTTGRRFAAALVQNSSSESAMANRDTAIQQYTLTTRRETILAFDMIIRRLRDGKTFRVTSDGTENKTPASAGLDMRQVTCEDWRGSL